MMYHKGIGRVSKEEEEAIKAAEQEERSTALRRDLDMISLLGKTLVDEGANDELIQAIRDLYRATKSRNLSISDIRFNGKRVSLTGTVIPSLQRRGLI